MTFNILCIGFKKTQNMGCKMEISYFDQVQDKTIKISDRIHSFKYDDNNSKFGKRTERNFTKNLKK